MAKYVRADSDTISVWLIAYGLPALLFTVGFAMTGYLNFWFGILAMVVAATIIVSDVWVRHNVWRRAHRISATFAICVVLAAIFWFVFVPAPLQVIISEPPGNYPKDETVLGIPWIENYFPLNVTVINNTDLAYDNFDSYFKTDNMLIVRAGVNGGINQCAATPENAAGSVTQATLSVKDKDISIPMFQPDTQFAASIYRVRCDKIASRSHIDILLALEGARANWAIGSFRYDAAHRQRGPLFIPKCLAGTCPNMPTTFVGG